MWVVGRTLIVLTTIMRSRKRGSKKRSRNRSKSGRKGTNYKRKRSRISKRSIRQKCYRSSDLESSLKFFKEFALTLPEDERNLLMPLINNLEKNSKENNTFLPFIIKMEDIIFHYIKNKKEEYIVERNAYENFFNQYIQKVKENLDNLEAEKAKVIQRLPLLKQEQEQIQTQLQIIEQKQNELNKEQQEAKQKQNKLNQEQQEIEQKQNKLNQEFTENNERYTLLVNNPQTLNKVKEQVIINFLDSLKLNIITNLKKLKTHFNINTVRDQRIIDMIEAIQV